MDVADLQSFEEFTRREYRGLVIALTFHCGDDEVAAELAQDALARAYQRWGRVSRMEHPEAWVRTVAFNLSRSQFRRRGAERRALARHGGTDVATGTSPEQVPDQIDVRRAVAGLPPRQREVVIHHYLLDRPVAEIAESLGVSVGAVKTALFKARAELGRVMVSAPITSDPPESHHG